MKQHPKALLALAPLVLALSGCANVALRDPGLTAEADRSEQRAIAAQKTGAPEVARIQEDRADRLRARAANYSVGDWVADVLVNLFLDGSAPAPRRR
ncbi:hypothetical protein ACG02S_11805 [Roseateles sp. DC23W]|uniref:Lipoprotein n=1 Tax=Pelomonas dachongensis TaxID=3299029 RepID=A0ABW7EME1_9BURK